MRSATFDCTSSFPPRWSRNVRSETLRTRTPDSASSASVISRPWPSFRALQLMSTTSVAVCDSTTSNAVTTPPTCPIATVRSPAALAEAGTSTRAVMAYPGPGTGTAGPYRRTAHGRGPARYGGLRGLWGGTARVCDRRHTRAARRWSSMTVRAGRAGSRAGAGAGGTAPTVLDPARIRNVVLVGPSGAGKTTLVEALLAHTGTIPRAGTVVDGGTVCDHDPAAVRQQRSVALAVAPLMHAAPDGADTKINLIDTPGYGDFVGELRAGLRAADAALFVVPASAGPGGRDRPGDGHPVGGVRGRRDAARRRRLPVRPPAR